MGFLTFQCFYFVEHPSDMTQVKMSQSPEKNNNTTETTGSGDTASDFTTGEKGVSSYL